MELIRPRPRLVATFVLLLLLPPAATAFSQDVTGTLTGRALDTTGSVLPGAEVTISSPAMIGGARTAFTDAQGVYRFTQLPAGEYQVRFSLQGFRSLNVEAVRVTGGATMTINGSMEIESVSTEITVTSTAPTIDLHATNIGINWDEKQMADLPYGRSVRGLIRLLPGVTPTQFDVAGNSVGGRASSGARSYGRDGGELMKYEGVIWDQVFGDYNTYDRVQVSGAAKGAEAQSAGLIVSLVIKSGGNKFSGNYLAAWQDGAFQGDNVTQELRDRGFDPGQNKFTRYNDVSGDLGGPILRDRLWFYGAYWYNYSGLFIPGFVSEATGKQAEFFTRLNVPTLKVTYQATHDNKVEFAVQANQKWQPYRGASRFVTLEASQNQKSWTMIGPAVKWTRIISQSMTFDAGLNRAGYWWPDKAWTSDVRRMDLTTTQTRGAFLEVYRKPARYGWNGTWSWFTNLHKMSHEIKSGFIGYTSTNRIEQHGYPNQELYRYRSLPGDTNSFLRPDSVQVFDYPNSVDSGVKYNAWYANDMVALSRKLTLNAGVRFDRYSIWLPEQGNPGTGPFAQESVYPENHGFPNYNAWSPRLSLVYDVTGTGRVALKASYGRYAAAGSGPTAASGPVAGDVNPATTFVRTYSNWDGTIPYVPVAANLASVTGGKGDLSIDPNAKPAYLDEYAGGVDLGLSPDLTVRLNVIHKKDFRRSKQINLAQPYDAYTDKRTAVDPGRDNIVGTADDGIVEVWSVPRSYPGFGKVQTLLTNAAPGEGNDRYLVFEATVSKRYSNGWSMLASYSGDRHVVRNLFPRNPNEARYNWQLPEVHYGLRLSGMYDLPWNVMLAATYTAQSGEYYPRVVQVRDALNQLVNVTVEGHAGRYDWVKLMDARVSKKFTLAGKYSLEGIVDVFNLLNTSVVMRQVNTNGPDYLKPLSTSDYDAASALPIPAARIFRLSVRWRF